jgi:radical SAM superfamily enzyme YgiQ (UPF0313 family)
LQKDILLITPPFTQLNTPYPATAYIKGFLNTKQISTFQVDLGIDVILSLFSKQGLINLFETEISGELSKNSKRILALKDDYIQTIDSVIQFLQGRNSTLSHAICSDNYLPTASRFNQLEDLEWAFGSMGLQDKAKHLATLYIEDISDYIVDNIDSNFGFSRYAERISSSAHTFDDLYNQLKSPDSFITNISLPILDNHIKTVNPKLVVISIPFPGNLFSALKCGEFIKANYPHIKITMGGGFPNTELRTLTDARLFEFVDFISLDDGEAPIEQLYIHLTEHTKKETLKRTFTLADGDIKYFNNPVIKDYSQKDVGTPDYTGLRLNEYISVIEVANPMHSLWSDGRWNKLTLAHGCYWAKCTFCDISLSYIKDYEPSKAELLVDRIQELVAATGENGFHFVDEAAPPKLLRDLALELIKRKVSISWWTNIRFEKNFSSDLCDLLKQSGCIAVSGGIEVASDRLLKLIDKGVDLQQLASVCSNFTDNGIMVHSYLMYGFPTQTDLETINSLEVVRQFFEAGIINSGFWHQFAMTAHSPIGLEPERFNVESVLKSDGSFANNDRPHIDNVGCDHEKYSQGLKTSIYNYMHGAGFELPLQNWFDFDSKQTTLAPNFIDLLLEHGAPFTLKPNTKVVWLETIPEVEIYTIKKKGKIKEMSRLVFNTKTNQFTVKGNANQIKGIHAILKLASVNSEKPTNFKSFEALYTELANEDFGDFMSTENFDVLKENGLLFL